MTDGFAGLRTRDPASGMFAFNEFQLRPPSVLLYIAAGVPTGADVDAYNVLGFVGSTAKATTSFVKPVAVQLAPPSVLVERPTPPRIAYSVEGVIARKRKTGPGLTTLQVSAPSVLLYSGEPRPPAITYSVDGVTGSMRIPETPTLG